MIKNSGIAYESKESLPNMKSKENKWFLYMGKGGEIMARKGGDNLSEVSLNKILPLMPTPIPEMTTIDDFTNYFNKNELFKGTIDTSKLNQNNANPYINEQMETHEQEQLEIENKKKELLNLLNQFTGINQFDPNDYIHVQQHNNYIKKISDAQTIQELDDLKKELDKINEANNNTVLKKPYNDYMKLGNTIDDKKTKRDIKEIHKIPIKDRPEFASEYYVKSNLNSAAPKSVSPKKFEPVTMMINSNLLYDFKDVPDKMKDRYYSKPFLSKRESDGELLINIPISGKQHPINDLLNKNAVQCQTVEKTINFLNRQFGCSIDESKLSTMKNNNRFVVDCLKADCTDLLRNINGKKFGSNDTQISTFNEKTTNRISKTNDPNELRILIRELSKINNDPMINKMHQEYERLKGAWFSSKKLEAITTAMSEIPIEERGKVFDANANNVNYKPVQNAFALGRNPLDCREGASSKTLKAAENEQPKKSM